MADTVIGGRGQGIYLVQKAGGRTVVQGLNETRQKFLEMGGDRNLFEKWMKEAAMVAAREAVNTAPVNSGKLASSIRGWASKTAPVKTRGGGVDRRMVFGGLITAGSARVRNTTGGQQVTTGVLCSTSLANNQWLATVPGAQTCEAGQTHLWSKHVRKRSHTWSLC